MHALKNLLFLTLSVFVSTTFAADNVNPNIIGNYTCKGYDPFDHGGNYTNYFSIIKQKNTYSIKWVDRNGYPTAYGTGIINSNLPDTLAVVYENMEDKKYTGIALYKIDADGSLKGIWTIKTDNKTGTETCTKKR